MPDPPFVRKKSEITCSPPLVADVICERPLPGSALIASTTVFSTVHSGWQDPLPLAHIRENPDAEENAQSVRGDLRLPRVFCIP